MTRREQKSAERFIVEQYLKARGWKAVFSEGGEPPDFWLELDGGATIAVEVLEYHQPWLTTQGHTLKQVEEAWAALRRYVVSYRETFRTLDKLSVRLEFSSFRVPGRKDVHDFVDAVRQKIEAVFDRLSERTTTIRISGDDQPVLFEYLRSLHICKVSCYMEWDWNHCVGGVGTSDQELLQIVSPKLQHRLQAGEGARYHLVVFGDGPGLSQVMAPWSVEQLDSFVSLRAALDAGPFDELALLSLDDFLWTREGGWCSLRGRGGNEMR